MADQEKKAALSVNDAASMVQNKETTATEFSTETDASAAREQNQMFPMPGNRTKNK